MNSPRDFFSPDGGQASKAKLTYKEAVRLELDTHKAVGGKVSEDQVEATMARFGLKDDLGELDSHPTHYDVDDATRDRLIAHTRQDVAMAYYAIRNTKQAVKGLRNIVWVLGLTNLFLLVVLVFR